MARQVEQRLGQSPASEFVGTISSYTYLHHTVSPNRCYYSGQTGLPFRNKFSDCKNPQSELFFDEIKILYDGA